VRAGVIDSQRGPRLYLSDGDVVTSSLGSFGHTNAVCGPLPWISGIVHPAGWSSWLASKELGFDFRIVGPTPALRMEGSHYLVLADEGVMAWLRPTIRRLNNLFSTYAEEDGFERPDPKYVREALSFLAGVLPADSAPPSIAPLNDGGIQAEWHRGGLDVELIFSPDPEERGLFIRDKGTGEEHDLPLERRAFAAAIGERLRVAT
jgi:hypothetical protein